MYESSLRIVKDVFSTSPNDGMNFRLMAENDEFSISRENSCAPCSGERFERPPGSLQ